MKGMKNIRGFTLVELMITLAIAAILLTIAIPSYRSMIFNNRMIAEINDITASLHHARSEATKRGVNVVVCKSADLASCTTAGNWTQGWIIFADDVTANQLVDAGEDIIQKYAGPSGTNSLTGTGVSANLVSFNRNGFSLGNTDDIMKVCDANNEFQARGLTIRSTGRIEKLTYTCP